MSVRTQKQQTRWLVVAGLGTVAIILASAIAIPNPSDWQVFVFRVVLALGAGATAALIPGFFNITVKAVAWAARAGGGLGVFFLVYTINPPRLIQEQREKEGGAAPARAPLSGLLLFRRRLSASGPDENGQALDEALIAVLEDECARAGLELSGSWQRSAQSSADYASELPVLPPDAPFVDASAETTGSSSLAGDLSRSALSIKLDIVRPPNRLTIASARGTSQGTVGVGPSLVEAVKASLAQLASAEPIRALSDRGWDRLAERDFKLSLSELEFRACTDRCIALPISAPCVGQCDKMFPPREPPWRVRAKVGFNGAKEAALSP